jgi:immune inhibitor A
MAHLHCIMPCSVPPHPELLSRTKTDLLRQKGPVDAGFNKKISTVLRGEAGVPGMNDGTIFPRSHYAQPTSIMAMSNAALERRPLRGVIRCVLLPLVYLQYANDLGRVIVVLVEFQDTDMAPGTKQRTENLWFSTDGRVPTGSVAEYYSEVSNGAVSLSGEVIGPFTLTKKRTHYASHRK